MLPGLKRLGHLTRPDPTIPESARADREIDEAARILGIGQKQFPVHQPNDVEAAFAAMGRERFDAAMIATQSFTFLHRQRIAEVALLHKLPTFGGFRELPLAGGLMAYGALASGGALR